MSKPKVLFVDDETRILDGLRRSLRGRRNEWDMSFAPGGAAALELIERAPIDVVVTDMRMPGMDGAELLTQVSERHPQIARAVLSGHTEPEAAIRAAVSGHRFLTKPTEVDALVTVIQELTARTCAAPVAARRIAGAVRSLPPLPEHLDRITELLGSADGDLSRVVHAVLLDAGLTGKLLQVANSGFFGPRPRNASVDAVVSATPVSTIQALVEASRRQWSGVSWPADAEAQMRAVWRHAVATASLVGSIATPAHRPYAQAAALLQDVGSLAWLAAGSPELAEVTVTDVAVELLRLWGLPAPIVAAVAERDTPHVPPSAGLGVSGAVRAAHLLVCGTGPAARSTPDAEAELELLLAHPQLATHSMDWREAAEAALEKAVRWVEP